VKKTALALTTVLLLTVSLVAGVESVKANFQPSSSIMITSPTNTTYNSRALFLNYSVFFVATQNQLVIYSLDGRANVTILNQSSYSGDISELIVGNTTLYGLSEGLHHLELYSENVNPGYAEVYFSIDTVAQEEPFPATLVFVASVGIAMITIGLFVYFKKFHRDKSP